MSLERYNTTRNEIWDNILWDKTYPDNKSGNIALKTIMYYYYLNKKILNSTTFFDGLNNKEDTELIIQKVKEHMAAYRIQQWWSKKIYWNPRHPVGVRVHNKKFDDIQKLK